MFALLQRQIKRKWLFITSFLWMQINQGLTLWAPETGFLCLAIIMPLEVELKERTSLLLVYSFSG